VQWQFNEPGFDKNICVKTRPCKFMRIFVTSKKLTKNIKFFVRK
jgi:hypothetical protein